MKILRHIRNLRLINRGSGFTLVELLVTVGILVTVIIIMLKLFIYNSILAEMSGNMGFAMSEAQTKMEEIRNHSFDRIVLDYTSTCACADHIDNDFPVDGKADAPPLQCLPSDPQCLPPDPQCLSYFDNDESDAAENRAVCSGTFALSQPTGTGTINITMIYPSTCAVQCDYNLIQVDIITTWQNKDGRNLSKTLTGYIARR